MTSARLSNTRPWRFWRSAVVGLCAMLGAFAALLVWAPATWVASAVAQMSDGRVLLSGAQGTLWQGSAQVVLSGGAQSQSATRLPQGVQWHLQPAWGGLQLDVRAPCCASHLRFDLGLAMSLQGADLQGVVLQGPALQSVALRVRAHDAQSQWPAQVLAGLGTPWNTLQLQGDLRVHTEQLVLLFGPSKASMQGQLVLQAQGLSSQLSTLRPMGSYTLTLQGGDTPSLQLRTAQGPLQLSGEGQWVGSRLRFSGEASAEPAQEAELANLLNIMGRRQGARSVITLG